MCEGNIDTTIPELYALQSHKEELCPQPPPPTGISIRSVSPIPAWILLGLGGIKHHQSSCVQLLQLSVRAAVFITLHMGTEFLFAMNTDYCSHWTLIALRCIFMCAVDCLHNEAHNYTHTFSHSERSAVSMSIMISARFYLRSHACRIAIPKNNIWNMQVRGDFTHHIPSHAHFQPYCFHFTRLGDAAGRE